MPTRRPRQPRIGLTAEDLKSPLLQPAKATEYARRLREQALENLKEDSRAAQDILDKAVENGLNASERLAQEARTASAPAYLKEFVIALRTVEQSRINPRDFQQQLERILQASGKGSEELKSAYGGALVKSYVGFTIKAARAHWFSQYETHLDVDWKRVPAFGVAPGNGPLPREEQFESDFPAELIKLYQSADAIDELDKPTAEALRIASDEYVGFNLSNIGNRAPRLTKQNEFIPPAQIMLIETFKPHGGIHRFVSQLRPGARDDVAAILDARVMDAAVQTAIVAIEDLSDRTHQTRLLTQATKYAELALDPDRRNTIFRALNSFTNAPLAERGSGPTSQQPQPTGPSLS